MAGGDENPEPGDHDRKVCVGIRNQMGPAGTPQHHGCDKKSEDRDMTTDSRPPIIV
jgi:hypothetical protein